MKVGKSSHAVNNRKTPRRKGATAVEKVVGNLHAPTSLEKLGDHEKLFRVFIKINIQQPACQSRVSLRQFNDMTKS